jgi:SulP family sulfate permease
MAGVILLLMGWAKLGGVIKYIPDPVVVGFTVGIAVIIWVGKDFFTEDQHVLGEPAFVTRLHTNNAQPKHFFDGSAVPS